MNFGGRLFTFRSLVRQQTQVTENELYVLLGLYLLMGIIQTPTLWAYFISKGFWDEIIKILVTYG
jgi:hypothetical protein